MKYNNRIYILVIAAMLVYSAVINVSLLFSMVIAFGVTLMLIMPIGMTDKDIMQNTITGEKMPPDELFNRITTILAMAGAFFIMLTVFLYNVLTGR